MKAFPPPRADRIYIPALRTIHWLMAALIFVALALGVWASQLPRGETRSEILFVHKSIGVTVLGLVALRLVWRLVARRAGLCRSARQADPRGGARGASRTLCPDDRDAGQRLSDVDRGRKSRSHGSGCSAFRASWARTSSSTRRRAGRTLCSPGRSRSCWPRISARSSGMRSSGAIPC